MTTLKQKFDYITQCYATIEEKNKMYYQAVKHWLQQKQFKPTQATCTCTKCLKKRRQRYKILDELLKELK